MSKVGCRIRAATAVALLAPLASTLLAPPSFAQATHILDNPDGVSVYLLQERYSNSTPDFEALAENDPSVLAADEFSKQALLDKIAAQLKSKFTALQSVDTIVISLYSTFGPYDSDHNEYDFDLSSGTFILYNALGHQVQLSLANGNDAQSWPLKPDDAKKILHLNNQQRGVTLVFALALENSPPALYGQPGVLTTKVISYDVLSSQNNRKLGHVAVQSLPK